MLLGFFSGIQSGLLVFIGFYWILLGFTGFYWVLLGYNSIRTILVSYSELGSTGPFFKTAMQIGLHPFTGFNQN